MNITPEQTIDLFLFLLFVVVGFLGAMVMVKKND